MKHVVQWRPAILLFLALCLLASPGFAGSREPARPVAAKFSGLFASLLQVWDRVSSVLAEGRGQLDPDGGTPSAPANPGEESNGGSSPVDPDRGPGLDPWG